MLPRLVGRTQNRDFANGGGGRSEPDLPIEDTGREVVQTVKIQFPVCCITSLTDTSIGQHAHPALRWFRDRSAWDYGYFCGRENGYRILRGPDTPAAEENQAGWIVYLEQPFEMNNSRNQLKGDVLCSGRCMLIVIRSAYEYP